MIGSFSLGTLAAIEAALAQVELGFGGFGGFAPSPLLELPRRTIGTCPMASRGFFVSRGGMLSGSSRVKSPRLSQWTPTVQI